MHKNKILNIKPCIEQISPIQSLIFIILSKLVDCILCKIVEQPVCFVKARGDMQWQGKKH